MHSNSVPAEPPIVTYADLRRALQSGWADYRAAPLFGLFFSAVYVLAGIALIQLSAGLMTWTLAATLGFPLVAPFLAVGLYEVSRRRANGIVLDWPGDG